MWASWEGRLQLLFCCSSTRNVPKGLGLGEQRESGSNNISHVAKISLKDTQSYERCEGPVVCTTEQSRKQQAEARRVKSSQTSHERNTPVS